MLYESVLKIVSATRSNTIDFSLVVCIVFLKKGAEFIFILNSYLAQVNFYPVQLSSFSNHVALSFQMFIELQNKKTMVRLHVLSRKIYVHDQKMFCNEILGLFPTTMTIFFFNPFSLKSDVMYYDLVVHVLHLQMYNHKQRKTTPSLIYNLSILMYT